MLAELTHTLNTMVASLEAHLPFLLKIVGVAWAIHLINVMFGHKLNLLLGLYPRSVWGLIGIPCSPWLHGSWQHLFLNSMFFLILASLVLFNGSPTFMHVSLFIITVGGLAMWFFARPAVHIGASGLIMGYWGYLLVNGWHTPNMLTITIGLLCVYYLGGMAANLFPKDRRTSWEGHVFGFASGILAAFVIPLLITTSQT